MNPFKDECLSSTLSPFRPNWVAEPFLPAPALALQSRTSPGQTRGEAEKRGGERQRSACLCVAWLPFFFRFMNASSVAQEVIKQKNTEGRGKKKTGALVNIPERVACQFRVL